MFIIFDDRLKPILKKHLGITEDVLLEMKSAYFDAVQKLQINEMFAYIEEHNLTEESEKIDALSDTSVSREQQINNLETVFRFIQEFGLSHPDFQDRVNAKVKELNSGLLDDLFKRLPPEAIAQIGEMMVTDMQTILAIKKGNPDFELPERLNRFQ